jgi:hypothetical protein
MPSAALALIFAAVAFGTSLIEVPLGLGVSSASSSSRFMQPMQVTKVGS